jgi:hypothetical protein
MVKLNSRFALSGFVCLPVPTTGVDGDSRTKHVASARQIAKE